jgi:hypothetical protein
MRQKRMSDHVLDGRAGDSLPVERCRPVTAHALGVCGEPAALPCGLMSMSVRRIGLLLVAVLAVAACSNGSGARALPHSAGRFLSSSGRAGRTTLRGPVAHGLPAGLGYTVRLPADCHAVRRFALIRPRLGRRATVRRSVRRPRPRAAPTAAGAERRASVSAVFVMPVLLALTDASGNTVLPALPGTMCRTPLPEVPSELDALAWWTSPVSSESVSAP